MLVEAGATEQEAACLAAELAQNPPPSPSDPSSPGSAISDAILEVGGHCADEDRLMLIAENAADQLEQDLDRILEPLRRRIAHGYLDAGATKREAECIANAFLSIDPKDAGVYGTTKEKALATAELLKEHASSCASPERLARLGMASVTEPFEAALQNAGATQRETECFINKVGELDLFFPSEDFNGPQAAEMGAARIAEDIGGCISEGRVRELVESVFGQYQEGCSRTSKDPLAPFDC